MGPRWLQHQRLKNTTSSSKIQLFLLPPFHGAQESPTHKVFKHGTGRAPAPTVPTLRLSPKASEEDYSLFLLFPTPLPFDPAARAYKNLRRGNCELLSRWQWRVNNSPGGQAKRWDPTKVSLSQFTTEIKSWFRTLPHRNQH